MTEHWLDQLHATAVDRAAFGAVDLLAHRAAMGLGSLLTTVPELACSDCGKVHSLEHPELVFFRPDPIAAMPKDQREALAKETNDVS